MLTLHFWGHAVKLQEGRADYITGIVSVLYKSGLSVVLSLHLPLHACKRLLEKMEPLRKRKRSYTVSEKLRYLRDFEEAIGNGNLSTLTEFANLHHIPVETIRRWNLHDLELKEEENRGKDRKVKQRSNGTWPEVEEQLFIWFQALRQRRLPVVIHDVQEKAMELFQAWWDALPEARREAVTEAKPQLHDFHASNGWVELFMERKKISLRKVTKNTTTIPVNAIALIQTFRDDITGTIDRFGIPMRLLFNMDETFVLFDFRPLYTLNEKGAKSVDIRTSRSNAKLGCTVTLCVAANGDKLPAHITVPRRGFVRQLNALEDYELPENVIVTSSQTGWVKEETIHHWLDEVFSPHIQEAQHFMLVVDRYRVHRTENFGVRVTEDGGLLNFIPAGCTSLVQPLDLTVMRSFKCHTRNAWKTWKKENTDETGRCEPIGLRDVVGIVSSAWDAVIPEVIENGFEAAFRPGNVDAGPHPVAEDEDVDGPDLEFINLPDDEMPQ